MKLQDFSIGMRGHDMGENMDEILQNCRSHGLFNLQLAMTKSMTDIDFDVLGYDAAFSEKTNTLLKENNIKLPILSCYIDPICKDDKAREVQLERFRCFLHYAADFSATAVATETGYVPLDTPDDEREKIYVRFIESIKSLLGAATEHNAYIAIEPVATSAVSGPLVMKRVIDELASDRIKVVLDISNLMTEKNYIHQKEIIDEAFSLFGDRITAVHLKDFNFDNGTKDFSVVGEGLLEAKYILSKAYALSRTPDIVLDTTPLALLDRSIENFEKILAE